MSAVRYIVIVNNLVNEMIWLALRADTVSDLSHAKAATRDFMYNLDFTQYCFPIT